MATQRHRQRSAFRNVVATTSRVALVVAFTGVETLALGVWLALVQDAPIASAATAVGLAALAGGLVLEHFLTDLTVNGFDVSIPGGPEITISLTETFLWALWLVVAEEVGGVTGVLVAGAVLAALLVPQHTIEDNVLRGRGLFDELLDSGTVGFSVIEAAGATAWLLFVFRGDAVTPLLAEADETVLGETLAQFGVTDLAAVDPGLVGLGVLALALLVEHFVAVSFARRE